MKARKILFGVFGVAAVLAVGLLCFAQKDDLYEEANKQFDKHNYKDARELFLKALDAGLEGEESARAGYRVAICSARLGEWDQAIKETTEFIEKHKGGVWEARGLHLRGNVFFDMPHYFFKTLQGQTVRGRYVRGGYREDTGSDDIGKSAKDLEAGRELYRSLIAKAGEKSQAWKDLRADAAALVMDLARVLEGMAGSWYFREALDEKKEDAEKIFKGAYDPSWPLRVRIAFCYNDAEGLDDTEGRHLAAVARYRKALFFNRFGFVRESEKPLPILDSLIAEFPKDSLADDALYATALMLEGKEDFLGAKLRYGTLGTKFPDSEWKNDCEYRVREMERPRIAVDSAGVRLPGGPQEITIKTRNVGRVSFAAFPVKLEKIFEDSKNENDKWWSYFDQFLTNGGGRQHWDMQEAEWEFSAADAGDHKWVEGKTRVPLTKTGAWVIEARGESVVFTSVLLVSDLAMVRKMDGNKMLVFVVDAVTGSGVQAPVAVREKYWTRSGYRSNYYTDETDESGLLVREIKPTGDNSKNIQVFAHVGGRYAATGHGSWYWSRSRGGYETRLYPYTDRPVYRPGQKVNFKLVAREKRDGGYGNLDGEDATIEIFDAKGKRVHLHEGKTGEFGSISGSFDLAGDAALGVYRMNLKIKGRDNYSVAGGQNFRVEEYKKPEFEVLVTSEKPQVKLGEKFRARINAKYYFGGPVANAEVTYKVTRKDYYHTYVPAGEFDWLYGRGYGWRPWWWYFYGPRMPQADEVAASGTAKTDANGDAFVEIDSSKYLEVGKDRKILPDHLFSISAEVRDESRRTIEGSGQVKVTRSEFYAFLETPRGFYDKGERAKFEIRTLNAGNAPVKTDGKVRVYALKPPADPSDEKAEPVKALLLDEDLSTDASGLGWYQFVPDKEGRFEVEFTAKDSWGGEVRGSREVWVVGEGFEGWRFRYSDVEVLTDKRSYEEGETARVMLNTDHRGADILFTIEVGNEIVEHRIVDMRHKSAIVPIRIDRKLMPNFFVRVAMFAAGKPFMEDVEVFAPPSGQFLDVSVKPSKNEYKPGEKASLEVAVKDRRGEAVECEVSLGVFDRSLLYIQPEYAPDIRKFYYGERRPIWSHPDNSLQHGFSSQEEDSRYYPELKLRGTPIGWRGYQHWRDYFGKESDLYFGARLDEANSVRRRMAGGGRGGESKGEDGAEGSLGAPPAPGMAAESKSLAKEERLESEKQGEAMDKDGKPGDPGGGEAAAEAEAAVRENFADQAYWNPAMVTGKDGVARFEFVMPDSLTSWKASAVAVDSGSKMGNSAAEVVTRKNLMVRLQAPRFFTERDEVVLSGLVNNYLSTDKKARVEFTLEGGCLEAMAPNSIQADVKAGGTARVDFPVKAVKDGKATVTVKAFTDEESDAMKMTFPVLVHGIDKTVTVTGVMRGYERNSMKLKLTVPAERDPKASKLEMKVSPSIASCMLDALPYLIEYPYGCVEQTMSRFLPAVTVARTLKELGVDLETVGKKRAEIDAARLSEHLKHGYRTLPDPVFQTAMLDRVVREGISRIYLFQQPDGGFGWWAGGRSDPYMTAYATNGLFEAKKAGYEVEDMRLGRAIAFLKAGFKEDKSLYRRAYIAWVLSQAGAADKEELDAIYDRRDDLNHYAKCLLAMTLFNAGRKEQASTTVENVLQFVKVDKDNGTCFIDTGAAQWWYWYNDRIEATVFLLRAMIDIKPGDERIHQIVKWLVNNRKGGRWNSTKDTANAIFALARYVKAEDELNPEYTVVVDWPGVARRTFNVTKANVFSFDDMFMVSGEKIPGGEHEITITREGKGSVYFTAHLTYFSKEEDIKGAGHELFVERTYWKMTRVKKEIERDGRKIEVEEWERSPLKQHEEVKSGDRIEVRLDIDCKNRYEYLVFEDMKAAGLEPVQLRSGFSYGNLCSNMELRDEMVVFFVDMLETGKHALTYQMRAEVPGKFHAMPTRAYAMYAPKVGGISDEWRLEIRD